MEKSLRAPLWRYAAVLASVIVLGLASREAPGLFPTFLGKYPGDALWATAVYLGWCFVFRNWSPLRVFCLAVGSSWAVEFLQLYQADWINAIRGYRLGHLILGSHFHRWDLVAYAAGAGLGWLGDKGLLALGKRSRSSRADRSGPD